MPRASARQYGAKRPENAGTKYIPALSDTLAANGSTSDADRMISSWSRSHCTADPVTATDPSSAYTGGAPSSAYPSVVRRPEGDGTMARPVLSSRKLPVPYVFLASPVAKQA